MNLESRTAFKGGGVLRTARKVARLRDPPQSLVGLAAAPLDAPTIGGEDITPLGFSLVPFLIVGGVFLLWFFGLWEERRERPGQDTLLERALLRIESLRAGLATLM
jgi:hypothetical protein